MLRNSGDVIAEAEHQDVVLRRRDGADLFLGLRSREESIRSALGVLARLLEPLARLIDGWRATAEVYGVPELRATLEVERTGPPEPIRRPEAA